MTKIAVIAAGAMGSGIGRVLHEGGADVVTLLEGRSTACVVRAATAGMRGVAVPEVAHAELVLSVVPPGQAMNLARFLAPVLASAAHKPIVADLNALDVATVRAIGQVIGATGAGFVDGGIIGGPPQPGGSGPTIYLSGDGADRVGATLKGLGLVVRTIEGGVGAASALKMSYAGITKGLTAIAAIMILGASRAGAAEALVAELQASQPQLATKFSKGLPDMVPKAYRWVAEMREIAAFLGPDTAGAAMFEAAAQFYERIAADAEGVRQEVGVLEGIAHALGKPK